MTDEHHAEQPEQWARGLSLQVGGIYMNTHNSMHDACNSAALTIQRAFAAREADLVGALEAAKSLIGAGNGDHPNEAIRQSNINQAWHILSAALKSREASHG